jgi:CubicO group peptidase (beta-lactamase class C family)
MLAALVALLSSVAAVPDWSAVDAVLQDAVRTHAFPGAVAIVAGADGIMYSTAVGAHTYAADATATSVNDTLWDMASVTKVVATTTATMLLYQRGLLSLDTPLVDLFGPSFARVDPRKADIVVRNLMLHNAGLPPDPTPVSFCAPSFGCPESAVEPPQHRALNFSCQPMVLDALMLQPLDNAPGDVFVYSDISMISMMFVIGSIARRAALVAEADLLPACVQRTRREGGHASRADRSAAYACDVDQCYYEAFVRTAVFDAALAGGAAAATPARFMGFRPPATRWAQCAPTWNDTSAGFPGECVKPFRERLLQGEVCDGNAYAMGGVAGHAGLFAAAPELHTTLAALLYAPASAARSAGALGVNATTVKLFTTIHNATQSSRALGWDTNSYLANSYRGCGNLSAATFTHTGYTGTQLCADPLALGGRGALTILLTNRVYPAADEGSLHRIHAARQAFNNAVLSAL